MKNITDLYFLRIKNAGIVSLDIRNNNTRTILENLSGTPDGIKVDHDHQRIYFTNMGVDYNQPDGTIETCSLDGMDHTVLVGNGTITTPKQLQLDKEHGLLYWCDREGGKIFRSRLDGSDIEVVIDNAKGFSGVVDIMDQCVGLVLDIDNHILYWTQKGPHKGNRGRIFSTVIHPTCGSLPVPPEKINVLLEQLPEPIDLALNRAKNILYWTDRGAPPKGNSLNCAVIKENKLVDHRVICPGFDEAIGLALDEPNNVAYVSDLGGSIYRVDIITGEKNRIYHNDSITGVTF